MKPQDEEEIHLRDYYYVLLKRKRIVIAFMAASFLLGVVLTFSSKVLYQATATLLIEKQNPNDLPTLNNDTADEIRKL